MKSITQLKLKVTDGTEPLMEAAVLCRRALNAAIEDWLLRQRGKRESAKQRKKNAKGQPLSESTKLYHAIRGAAPSLHTQAAAQLAATLNSNLSAKVDWRRGSDNGSRPKRKDAILSYEDRPPFTTQLQVPLHNRHVFLDCGDVFRVSTTGIFTGHRYELTLSTKQLTRGQKTILREIQAGNRKLACSRLIYKEPDWYWYLPVEFESAPLVSDRAATLEPVVPLESAKRQSDRPFKLHLPDRTWFVGDGRYYVLQMVRLIGLRKQIGWRYRQRFSAGHGRKKVDAAMIKRHRQASNIRDEVRRRAIADVVRQCERNQCGKLVYREPTDPVKTRLWFKQRGVEWDWTRWLTDLRNACHRAGIEVEVKKLKIKDLPKNGDERKSA